MRVEAGRNCLVYRFPGREVHLSLDDLDRVWVVRGHRSAMALSLVVASVVSLCVALPALFVVGPATAALPLAALVTVAYGAAVTVGRATRRATIDVMAWFTDDNQVVRLYAATDETDLDRFLADLRRAHAGYHLHSGRRPA